MTRSTSTRQASRRAARGFTLIELMVAITLGLFLIIGLITLVVSNVTTRNELDKSARQIDSGRYAVQVLADDLQNAGYFGIAATTEYTGVTPAICPSAVADLGYLPKTSPGISAVPLPVYAVTSTPGCITNVVPNTAILIVSRVNTKPILATAKVASETYMQLSSCATDLLPFKVAAGSASFTLLSKDCSTASPLRKVVHRIYFLSSCNVCGSDTTPTLKVAELVNGAMVTTPLSEGIENLQYDYGIDMDGDGAPDCYTSNPTAPPAVETAACPTTAPPHVWTDATANWTSVMAVRIHLLARNVDKTGGWSDASQYDMGLASGQVGPFSDAYKRHVYSTTVRLYNGSGQREQP
jgi:type IV pilus assembly protein PilW